jgi:hypothetical protein
MSINRNWDRGRIAAAPPTPPQHAIPALGGSSLRMQADSSAPID